MDALVRMLKKELKEVERIGLNPTNLDLTFKIVDIIKDIYEIKEKELEMEDEDKMRRFFEEKYPLPSKVRKYGYGSGDVMKPYSGTDSYIKKHLEKIMEAAEEYDIGKERYKHGEHEQHMHDGLDKLMFALCDFIEGLMEYAETAPAKEMIKNHIHKLNAM